MSRQRFRSGKWVASAQLQGWRCSRLQLERESGGDEDHRVAGGADFAVRPALPVAEFAPNSVVRHDAHANFVGYEDRRAGELNNGVGESRDRGTWVRVRQHQIAEPKG